MRAATRIVCAASLVLLASWAPAAAQDGPIAQEQMKNVVGALDALRQSIYALQDVIIDNQNPEQQTGLYQQADGVLMDLTAFKKQLIDRAPREDLVFNFNKMERKLNGLLDLINSLGAAYRPVQVSAARVRTVNDELHYAITGGQVSKQAPLQGSLEKQARLLTDATQGLALAAKYALGKADADKDLLASLAQLSQATAAFAKQVAGKSDLEGVKSSFAAVNTAWEGVAAGLKRADRRETAHFMYSATRVDEIQDRLFRMLGMPGKRTKISLDL